MSCFADQGRVGFGVLVESNSGFVGTARLYIGVMPLYVGIRFCLFWCLPYQGIYPRLGEMAALPS